MPYELIWEPAGIYRRYYGDLTIAQCRQAFDAICADARFDSLGYAITDFSDVLSLRRDADALAELAAAHIGALVTNRNILAAAVATRPEILQSIQEFVAFGFMQTPYRVFSTVADARRWIGTEQGLRRMGARPPR